MAQPPVWAVMLSGLMTPVIGAIAVFIAWQQWRTNRNKLKYDLFEKRFAIYLAATHFISSILGSGKAKSEKSFEFLSQTYQAKFLFNEAISDYLYKELYSKATELQMYESELQGLPVGDERTRLVKVSSDIKRWYGTQLVELDKKFAPFLQLAH